MHACTHIHARTHMRIPENTCTHARMHAHPRTHAHTYTHAYFRASAQINACVFQSTCFFERSMVKGEDGAGERLCGLLGLDPSRIPGITKAKAAENLPAGNPKDKPSEKPKKAKPAEKLPDKPSEKPKKGKPAEKPKKAKPAEKLPEDKPSKTPKKANPAEQGKAAQKKRVSSKQAEQPTTSKPKPAEKPPETVAAAATPVVAATPLPEQSVPDPFASARAVLHVTGAARQEFDDRMACCRVKVGSEPWVLLAQEFIDNEAHSGQPQFEPLPAMQAKPDEPKSKRTKKAATAVKAASSGLDAWRKMCVKKRLHQITRGGMSSKWLVPASKAPPPFKLPLKAPPPAPPPGVSTGPSPSSTAQPAVAVAASPVVCEISTPAPLPGVSTGPSPSSTARPALLAPLQPPPAPAGVGRLSPAPAGGSRLSPQAQQAVLVANGDAEVNSMTPESRRAAWMAYIRSRKDAGAHRGKAGTPVKIPSHMRSKVEANLDYYFRLWIGSSKNWATIEVIETQISEHEEACKDDWEWLRGDEVFDKLPPAIAQATVDHCKTDPEKYRPNENCPGLDIGAQFLVNLKSTMSTATNLKRRQETRFSGQLAGPTGVNQNAPAAAFNQLGNILGAAAAVEDPTQGEANEVRDVEAEALEKARQAEEKRSKAAEAKAKAALPHNRLKQWLAKLPKVRQDIRTAAAQTKMCAHVEVEQRQQYEKKFGEHIRALSQLQDDIEARDLSGNTDLPLTTPMQRAEGTVLAAKGDVTAWLDLCKLYEEAFVPKKITPKKASPAK